MSTPTDFHTARVRLFAEAYRRGYVTLAEIEEAIPASSERPSERWLTLYCLQAIGVEVRSEAPPALRPQSVI